MISYNEPAITPIEHPAFQEAGATVRVLHEYENNKRVSGNKWWKLRDNLEQAKQHPSKTILTFGGAYSNHISATAAGAKEAGLRSIGIIRGEDVENKTLSFARSQGMQLEFVSREDYRRKTEEDFLGWLNMKFGEHFLIPEGGTNQLAVSACADWGQKLKSDAFDTVYVPVGTAGTIAGLAKGIGAKRKITGVSVLRNDGHIDKAIQSLTGGGRNNWQLLNDYHFGGYGKSTQELRDFCTSFSSQYKITIEPVYTGKLFWAIIDQAKKGLIPRGSNSLVIHTGGLQYLH
jgi:1-aminocyclopropane-1-carboxylate deaminase